MSKFYKFKNESGAVPELLVYGEIDDWWGDVQAKDFVDRLKRIDAKEIHVRIHSPGGSVFTAQAIYSSLKHHTANIKVYIDGIAASAATIIAMAGDEIIMPDNAMMMIHNPVSAIYGEADELRELADVLDKVRDTIVAAYRGKTGLSDEKIVELMASETWMTASEAKDLGFVDEVSESIKVAAKWKDNSLVINGLTVDDNVYKTLPVGWLADLEDVTNESQNIETEGDKVMTLEELKENHPDIYNAVIEAGQKEGAKQERERIRAIEDMAMPGHEELIVKAKFDDAITPEAFAVELIKAEKALKEGYLKSRQNDAEHLKNVQPSVASDQVVSDEDKRTAIVNPMAAAFTRKNKRG